MNIRRILLGGTCLAAASICGLATSKALPPTEIPATGFGDIPWTVDTHIRTRTQFSQYDDPFPFLDGPSDEELGYFRPVSPSERRQFEALARANRGNALAQNPGTTPGRTSDWSLWAIGFGTTGHFDADGLMPKVNTSGAGVVVGLTHRADTWTAGVHYVFNAS